MCIQAGNVTKERMAGYDRAIRSEPHFEPGQAAGLIKDLTAYLQTLQVSLNQLSWQMIAAVLRLTSAAADVNT